MIQYWHGSYEKVITYSSLATTSLHAVPTRRVEFGKWHVTSNIWGGGKKWNVMTTPSPVTHHAHWRRTKPIISDAFWPPCRSAAVSFVRWTILGSTTLDHQEPVTVRSTSVHYYTMCPINSFQKHILSFILYQYGSSPKKTSLHTVAVWTSVL